VRKSYQSDLLGQKFRIFVSMKAKRCIAKKGSFDNYLL
jgi:ribosomal protein L28